MKLCLICGEPLPEEGDYRIKFCGKECRRIHNQRYMKQWNKEHYAAIKLLRTKREERLKNMTPEQLLRIVRGER
jgi:endogenous inhibitor of DNA gyrase (YacG/DUF329 family)